MNKKDQYFDNCELLGLGKDAETLKDVLVYKVKENDFIWVKPLERILEDNIDECKILDVFKLAAERLNYPEKDVVSYLKEFIFPDDTLRERAEMFKKEL